MRDWGVAVTAPSSTSGLSGGVDVVVRAAPRRRFGPVILRTLVAVAFLGFIVANRSELPVAWRAVREASISWMLITVAIAAALVLNLAGLHDASQRVVGVRRPFRRTLRLSLGAHFLNMVTKSGGMAGVVPFSSDARSSGRSVHASSAGYVLGGLVLHLGFTGLLFVAIGVILNNGNLRPVELAAVAMFVVLTAILVGGMAAAARSRQSIRRLYAIPARIRSRARRLLRRPVSEFVTDNTGADELYDAVLLMRSHRNGMWRVVAHAIMFQVLAVALLWSVLRSLGIDSGVTVALIAYAIATMFGIVGVLPAGIGFAEVSMAASLTSFHVSAGHAAAAVGVFRLLELWLPITIGAFALRATKRSPIPVPGEP